jgi:hypothetical protein
MVAFRDSRTQWMQTGYLSTEDSARSYNTLWLGTKLNVSFDLCERALPLDKNNIRALGILALE